MDRPEFSTGRRYVLLQIHKVLLHIRLNVYYDILILAEHMYVRFFSRYLKS